MRNWMKSVLLAVAIIGFPGSPVAGADLMECKRACRDAIATCVQVCNTSPVAGRARGLCKTACRRARRPCVQICRTQLPG